MTFAVVMSSLSPRFLAHWHLCKCWIISQLLGYFDTVEHLRTWWFSGNHRRLLFCGDLWTLRRDRHQRYPWEVEITPNEIYCICVSCLCVKIWMSYTSREGVWFWSYSCSISASRLMFFASISTLLHPPGGGLWRSLLALSCGMTMFFTDHKQ